MQQQTIVILPAGSDKPATAIMPGGQVVHPEPGESLEAFEARLSEGAPPCETGADSRAL